MGNNLSLSNYYENYETGFTSSSSSSSNNGSGESTKRRGHIINFEDIQTIVGVNPTPQLAFAATPPSSSSSEHFLLISTLDAARQDCIIKNTVSAKNEESQINDIISGKNEYADRITVVVYGKNASDESVMTKYTQLKTLGILNVCVYLGGMFEWLLLQDIYGPELFPTTGKCLDILEFRAPSVLLR